MSVISDICLGFRIGLSTLPNSRSRAALLVQIIAVPLLSALLYWYIAVGASQNADFAALSAACVGAITLQVLTTYTGISAQNRFDETEHYLAVSGGRVPFLTLGKNLVVMLVGLCAACVSVFGVVLAAGGQYVPMLWWLKLALVCIISVIGMLGFAQGIAVLSQLFADPYALPNVCGFILPLLCGSVASVSLYHPILRGIAYLIPISWATQAARAISESNILPYYWYLLGLILVDVGWRIIAFLIKRYLRKTYL